jgi:protein-S-isoprenylcysteine O-methyltransferase Ste14
MFGLVQLTLIMGLLLFCSAGSLSYVEGWVFLSNFSTASLLITLYLARNDPSLLARRVQAGPVAETRRRQTIIQLFASAAFLAIVIVPALDHRFTWSRVPVSLVVLGNTLVAVGFLIVFSVFKANTFASATIEVGSTQKLIDTGPYARVRHPMYAGALVLLTGTPLALGSYWGLCMLMPFTGILMGRVLDEEALLSQQLPGYEGYCHRTRYRLVPHLW